MNDEIMKQLQEIIINHAKLNEDNELCIKEKKSFAYKVFNIFEEYNPNFIKQLIEALRNHNSL